MGSSIAFFVSYVLLWVAVLGLGIMMVATLRHLGLVYEAINPLFRFTSPSTLHRNDPLPEIPLKDQGYAEVNLRQFAGTFLFILVILPDCQPCQKVLEGARDELAGMHAIGWRTLVIVPGDVLAATKLHDQYQGSFQVLADPLQRTIRDWGIVVTPFALVVDGSGRVQRVLPSVTAEQVRATLVTAPTVQLNLRRLSSTQILVDPSQEVESQGVKAMEQE